MKLPRAVSYALLFSTGVLYFPAWCQQAGVPAIATREATSSEAQSTTQTPEATKATALLRDKFVDVLLNGGAARVEALLKRGANPNVYGNDGLTPLFQALSASETLPIEAAAVRKVLYKYGANPNLPAPKSRATALMGETLWGRAENVGELLQHGANPDLQNSRGQTALMWAMLNGHVAIAKKLLAHHADVTIKDKDGKTALDYESKPVEILYTSGVSFQIEGATPAEKKRYAAMIEHARREAAKRYEHDMRQKRADIAKQIHAATLSPKAPEIPQIPILQPPPVDTQDSVAPVLKP